MFGLFRKTTEDKVADTLLHSGVSVILGGKQVELPRPTLSVWVEVSRHASHLTEYNEVVSMQDVLVGCSDAVHVANILSCFVCGVRRDNVRERDEYARLVMETIPTEDVRQAIVTILNECGVGELFMLTASLKETTITKPTRGAVESQTASGHR